MLPVTASSCSRRSKTSIPSTSITSALRRCGISFCRMASPPESVRQKKIESSPGCPYPAAYCFFRLRPAMKVASESATDMKLDQSFRAGLLAYIEASREKLAEIDRAARAVLFGRPARDGLGRRATRDEAPRGDFASAARRSPHSSIQSDPSRQEARGHSHHPARGNHRCRDADHRGDTAPPGRDHGGRFRRKLRLPNRIVALDR